MIINSNELIEEFFSEVKEQYPNITLEELQSICSSPWLFLRDEMNSGRLTKVKFKYLGTFQVYPKRVAYILSLLDKRLEEKKITQKHYDTTKKIYEEFLKNNKKND